MNLGLTIFFQHTPSRAVSFGVIKSEAVLIPTVIGVATAIARIIGGVIGNMSCTNRTLQYGISICVGGLLLMLTSQATTFLSISILGAVTGFVAGRFRNIHYLKTQLIVEKFETLFS